MIDYNNKTVLITGGAGFIGSRLALKLQELYPEANIVIFDKFRNNETFPSGNPTSFGHFKNLIEFKGSIITGDITSEEDRELITQMSIDYIFHLAAISDTTVQDQNLMMKTNFSAFGFIMNLAEYNEADVVYASSAAVYGNTSAPNVVGKGEIPANVYGFSKLSMDKFTRKYIEDDPRVAVAGLRFFNVYGPGETYKGKTSSMIYQMTKKTLDAENIKLFEWGEQTRDFVHVDDVVNACMLAMGISGIFNVGSGVSASFKDILSSIQYSMKSKVHVEWIKNPYSFYQDSTRADLSSESCVPGYVPQIHWKEGFSSYIELIKTKNL